MDLIGSTAIEDKLQDKCSETINAIREAGIKFWVLTGDKIETAQNIGYQVGVIDRRMQIYRHRYADEDTVREKFDFHEARYEKKIKKHKDSKHALIIGGDALLLMEKNSDLKKRFLAFSSKMSVVICCRVSPKQKSVAVNWIKHQFPTKRTLSIGDGANDVAMIMEAHVGVGIAGREGMQAARASDFAFGQFKQLKPLLFVHGRECYRRNSDILVWTFYKNMLYITAQFWFGFYSTFSG